MREVAKIECVLSWWKGRMRKNRVNFKVSILNESGSQLSATFVESPHQWRDLNISLLISACTHLSLFPSTTALPSPFISCSLSLSTAVWWEDQGLQRGWVPQGEYQQRCSALHQLSGSADVDVIRYLMEEEAELTEGTQETYSDSHPDADVWYLSVWDLKNIILSLELAFTLLMIHTSSYCKSLQNDSHT